MDKYTATEQAYKNGYEAGKKDAEDEILILKQKRANMFEILDAYERGRADALKWIPVSERLPDRMGQCVCRYVFGDNEEYPFYQVLWYYTAVEQPHFQSEGTMGLRVTHWMPLPEPPKEE